MRIRNGFELLSWSDIRSGFEEPGGTPPPRISRSNPPPPPQRVRKLFWNRSSSGGFLISTKIVSHVSENTKKRTTLSWKVLTDWCHATFDISILSRHYFGSNMMPTCAKRQWRCWGCIFEHFFISGVARFSISNNNRAWLVDTNEGQVNNLHYFSSPGEPF